VGYAADYGPEPVTAVLPGRRFSADAPGAGGDCLGFSVDQFIEQTNDVCRWNFSSTNTGYFL